jgi:hypothetical protein
MWSRPKLASVYLFQLLFGMPDLARSFSVPASSCVRTIRPGECCVRPEFA